MKGFADLNLTLGGTIAFTVVPAEPKVGLTLMFGDGFVVTGDADTMDTDIPEGKRIKIQVTPMDVSGNPAVIDGNAVWTSEDATRLQVVPDVASPHQLQAWIENGVGGTLGPGNVQIDVDADQGTGVRTVSKVLTFAAVAGEAAALGVDQIGALEDIPPAP